MSETSPVQRKARRLTALVLREHMRHFALSKEPLNLSGYSAYFETVAWFQQQHEAKYKDSFYKSHAFGKRLNGLSKLINLGEVDKARYVALEIIPIINWWVAYDPNRRNKLGDMS